MIIVECIYKGKKCIHIPKKSPIYMLTIVKNTELITIFTDFFYQQYISVPKHFTQLYTIKKRSLYTYS
jgi:hypothetical protein